VRCRQIGERDGGLDGLEGRGDLAVASNVGSAELLDRGNVAPATAHRPAEVIPRMRVPRARIYACSECHQAVRFGTHLRPVTRAVEVGFTYQGILGLYVKKILKTSKVQFLSFQVFTKKLW